MRREEAMAHARIQTALSKHHYNFLKKVGEGSFGAAILCQHDSEKERETKARHLPFMSLAALKVTKMHIYVTYIHRLVVL